MFFLIPMVATGLAALIVGGGVGWTVGAIVGVGGMATSFLGARALWRRFARRAGATVQHLRDALAHALQES
jgi:predicted flavoprotein YhiN